MICAEVSFRVRYGPHQVKSLRKIRVRFYRKTLVFWVLPQPRSSVRHRCLPHKAEPSATPILVHGLQWLDVQHNTVAILSTGCVRSQWKPAGALQVGWGRPTVYRVTHLLRLIFDDEFLDSTGSLKTPCNARMGTSRRELLSELPFSLRVHCLPETRPSFRKYCF